MKKPIDVTQLNKDNPIESMFMQLVIGANMNPSERKIIADLFNQHQGVRPLTSNQTSLLTSIYLKYHDAASLPKKERASKAPSAKAPEVPSAPKHAGRWTKFL